MYGEIDELIAELELKQEIDKTQKKISKGIQDGKKNQKKKIAAQRGHPIVHFHPSIIEEVFECAEEENGDIVKGLDALL